MFTFSQIKSLIKDVIFTLLFMSLFLSCERNESDLFEPVEYEKFSGVLFSKTLRLEDVMDEVFRQFGIQSIESILRKQGIPENEIKSITVQIKLYIKLSSEYDVHGITYHTVNPKGEKVVASGVLYYPKSHNPKGVIEVVPWFKSKNECGTVNYYMPEVIPGINGYVYIVPDQIGYGSTADLPIGYLQYENVAVVSADMRQAVEELVYNHYHRKLDKKSILFGYSLGAGGALTLARYYQQYAERGVKVKNVFIGGGAYDPALSIESQFSSYYSEHAACPNIICSLNYYEDLQLDFNRIFKGELLKYYEEWCYGQYSIDKLTQLLGTDLREYFTDSFLKKEDSPEYQHLLQSCRQKRIPNDWTPAFKIHLFHGKDDTLVPIICSDRLYDNLRSRGADVTYKQYEANHMGSAQLMIIDFWKFLNNR